MTDLISRADAIDAVAEEWLSEASAESPYVNDNDIDRYRELAEELFADIPSADAPKGDLISRQWLLEVYGDYIGDNGEPKYHVPLEVVRQNIKDAPSAKAEWIPCSERLPKAEDMYQIPEQRYLCQLEAHGERKFCVLSRLKGAVSPFWDWYGIAVYDSEVVAWMPLPKPYREEGEA